VEWTLFLNDASGRKPSGISGTFARRSGARGGARGAMNEFRGNFYVTKGAHETRRAPRGRGS